MIRYIHSNNVMYTTLVEYAMIRYIHSNNVMYTTLVE